MEVSYLRDSQVQRGTVGEERICYPGFVRTVPGRAALIMAGRLGDSRGLKRKEVEEYG